jgi:hypothetical protein
MLVAGTASAGLESDRAIADSLIGNVPEVAASPPTSSPPFQIVVGATGAAVDSEAESGTTTTARKERKRCPTRNLVGRYNRCR